MGTAKMVLSCYYFSGNFTRSILSVDSTKGTMRTHEMPALLCLVVAGLASLHVGDF